MRLEVLGWSPKIQCSFDFNKSSCDMNRDSNSSWTMGQLKWKGLPNKWHLEKRSRYRRVGGGTACKINTLKVNGEGRLEI